MIIDWNTGNMFNLMETYYRNNARENDKENSTYPLSMKRIRNTFAKKHKETFR